MSRRGKYSAGSVVAHNGGAWKVIGREQIMPTQTRRYILQDLFDPENLKTGRADKLQAIRRK